MRTEGYGPPGYGRMPVPMQTGYAVVPPHYASQGQRLRSFTPQNGVIPMESRATKGRIAHN